MAYTIEQKPNKLAGANSPMVFVLKDTTNYSATKFRYIAQVFINGVEKAKIKLYKNDADVGIVDVHKIVRTYLETQEKNVGNVLLDTISGSIHSIGISDTSNSYSQNTNQLVKIELKAGYEKSTSATTAPEEELDEANWTIYSIPATTPFTDTGANIGGLDISGTNYPFAGFIPEDATRKFLTNSPKVQFVRGSSAAADNVDELTVAFINYGLINDGDVLGRIYIQYFDSSGGQIGSDKYFVNDVASGGKATADNVKNSLLYFGCGTANLQNQVDEPDAQPSDFTDWAYYRIYGTSADGSTQETDYYYFYRYGSGASGIDDRHQSCTRFDNVRLA